MFSAYVMPSPVTTNKLWRMEEEKKGKTNRDPPVKVEISDSWVTSKYRRYMSEKIRKIT